MDKKEVGETTLVTLLTVAILIILVLGLYARLNQVTNQLIEIRHIVSVEQCVR